jgi:predicted O-methyltransferase YrrM
MQELHKVIGNEDTIRVPLAALEVLNTVPAKLTASERLLLFTLIYSLRPLRYLEIGTFKGGSALLVAAAMDAADYPGRIACVDIRPQVEPEHWKQLESRASMVIGDANEVLPEAQRKLGGPFDFVLIDGDHRLQAVIRDATKAMAVLSPGGHLLFHDSFCDGVKHGVDEFVRRHPGYWIDFGNITREYTVVPRSDGSEEPFCGFRLLQQQTGSYLARVGGKCRAAAKSVFRKPVRLGRRLLKRAGSRQKA